MVWRYCLSYNRYRTAYLFDVYPLSSLDEKEQTTSFGADKSLTLATIFNEKGRCIYCGGEIYLDEVLIRNFHESSSHTST